MCLHAAVFTLLVMNLPQAKLPVPIGVELRYAPTATMAPQPEAKAVLKPQLRPAMRADGGEIPAAKAPPQVVPQVTQPPIPEVISLSGPMGELTGQNVSPFDRYKYELRLFLQSRQVYPQVALRLRQKGVVTLRFTLNADGSFADVRMDMPSRFEILNNAALELVKQAPRFKPLPEDLKVSNVQFSYQFEYTL